MIDTPAKHKTIENRPSHGSVDAVHCKLDSGPLRDDYSRDDWTAVAAPAGWCTVAAPAVAAAAVAPGAAPGVTPEAGAVSSVADIAADSMAARTDMKSSGMDTDTDSGVAAAHIEGAAVDRKAGSVLPFEEAQSLRLKIMSFLLRIEAKLEGRT